MAEESVDNLLQVEFVSPEKIFYSGKASTVVARTRGGGDIAFLYGHEPFIGSLLISEVKIINKDDDTSKSFAVRGGFVSVNGSTVTILSDAIVPSEDIKLDKVKIELAEATELFDKNPEESYYKEDIQWAQIREFIATK